MNNQKQIFDKVSIAASRFTTHKYSTSFTMGIKSLGRNFQDPIYAIYGFVRFADEIVDTFHDFDKAQLLADFRTDTVKAIEQKISLNPILNSFQHAYHHFNFEWELVDQFLKSMEMDLNKNDYDRSGFENYILGSAEVVGLMCLKVFTNGNNEQYLSLKPYAMSLGAAFQKINFLRDIKADYEGLGRTYFPGFDFENFTEAQKNEIESEIARDFAHAYEGIKKLPREARFGVYVAYVYYLRLFKKIKDMPYHRIMHERVRIPNQKKFALVLRSYVLHNLNLL